MNNIIPMFRKNDFIHIKSLHNKNLIVSDCLSKMQSSFVILLTVKNSCGYFSVDNLGAQIYA